MFISYKINNTLYNNFLKKSYCNYKKKIIYLDYDKSFYQKNHHLNNQINDDLQNNINIKYNIKNILNKKLIIQQFSQKFVNNILQKSINNTIIKNTSNEFIQNVFKFSIQKHNIKNNIIIKSLLNDLIDNIIDNIIDNNELENYKKQFDNYKKQFDNNLFYSNYDNNEISFDSILGLSFYLYKNNQ
jgi:hypothetical protein